VTDQHASVRNLLLALVLLPALSPPLLAQGRNDATLASPCWRFSFGEWTPPLDWARSGHAGDASSTASAVRRIRDSVFARDSVASASNAMTFEKTARGAILVLYPPWWPAGVEVTFDSTLADGKEMLGTGIAMVADARNPASRAPARAWQISCGGR
jgi:hypothetical protein